MLIEISFLDDLDSKRWDILLEGIHDLFEPVYDIRSPWQVVSCQLDKTAAVSLALPSCTVQNANEGLASTKTFRRGAGTRLRGASGIHHLPHPAVSLSRAQLPEADSAVDRPKPAAEPLLGTLDHR